MSKRPWHTQIASTAAYVYLISSPFWGEHCERRGPGHTLMYLLRPFWQLKTRGKIKVYFILNIGI